MKKDESGKPFEFFIVGSIYVVHPMYFEISLKWDLR